MVHNSEKSFLRKQWGENKWNDQFYDTFVLSIVEWSQRFFETMDQRGESAPNTALHQHRYGPLSHGRSLKWGGCARSAQANYIQGQSWMDLPSMRSVRSAVCRKKDENYWTNQRTVASSSVRHEQISIIAWGAYNEGTFEVNPINYLCQLSVNLTINGWTHRQSSSFLFLCLISNNCKMNSEVSTPNLFNELAKTDQFFNKHTTVRCSYNIVQYVMIYNFDITHSIAITVAEHKLN